MLFNLFEYEAAAREITPSATWGYQSGGANDEITLAANRRAWDEISIRYRTMVDVSERDPRTSVLGTPVALPVLIAPTAMQKLAHPDGECGMARAAAHVGTVMVVSTTATTSLGEVGAASSGPKWFQLYIFRGREGTEVLVQEAVRAGYRALVLTVDVPILGKRERDLRSKFALPDGLQLANEVRARGIHDTAVVAKDIAWLRELSGLPVLVKGVVRGDDARRAVDHGASGIIVSNHGGRQLDTAVATARALPEVVSAVGHQAEVYVDGGIRRGTDVLKALALGARAVLLGRPPVWGLAVRGAAGAQHVLELLRDEFDLAMALAGCRNVDEITADLLVPRS